MLSVPDNAKLYLPNKLQPVIGAVQFIHGMGEHQGRYEDFAEYLSSNGYAVITSDLKGHGTNVSREADLGYIGDGGASGLVSDIHEMTRIICERCPNVPYILIGHGMGALIATAYFKKYDYFLSGMILSGMPSERERFFDKLRIRIELAFKGEYYRSHSLYSSFYGFYTNSYLKEGSPSAWLSSDSEVWKEFDKDPRCGFVYTLNGYKTYIDLLETTYRKGSWILKNKHVPIRIIAGSRDSCAGNKHKLSKIASVFRDHEYDNTEIQLIHGLRHDIYHDSGSEKTFDYILDELDQISENSDRD